MQMTMRESTGELRVGTKQMHTRLLNELLSAPQIRNY